MIADVKAVSLPDNFAGTFFAQNSERLVPVRAVAFPRAAVTHSEIPPGVSKGDPSYDFAFARPERNAAQAGIAQFASLKIPPGTICRQAGVHAACSPARGSMRRPKNGCNMHKRSRYDLGRAYSYDVRIASGIRVNFIRRYRIELFPRGPSEKISTLKPTVRPTEKCFCRQTRCFELEESRRDFFV